MKNLFRSAKAKVAAIGAGLMVVSSGAFAAIDTSKLVYNTDDPTIVAGFVLGAVAMIWGLRKAIAIANRG